jgi:hypothetical protein
MLIMTLLAATSPALTQETILTDGDTVTGIRNLDVNGEAYDVDFLLESSIDLYGEQPVFDFDEAGARDTAFFVVSALNNTEFQKVGPEANVGVPDYAIPFELNDRGNTIFFGGTFDFIFLNVWVPSDRDFWMSAEAGLYAKVRTAGGEAPPPPEKGFPINVTGVTDMSGDAVPDLALLAFKGQPKVRYFSGESREAIKSVKYFSNSWWPVAAATVTDSNSNGVADDPAVAVLGVKLAGENSDNNAVEVRRADTGAQINKITFLNDNWLALDVAVINDLNSDGVTGDTGIAVLGLNPERGDEWIKVQVRKLDDGALVANWFFLNANWVPLGLEAVDRLGQPALLAVLATKPNTGSNTVQARKLNNGAVQRDTTFWDPNWLARDVTILKDSNGDGNANDPGSIVHAVNKADNRNKVQGKQVSDGVNLKSMGVMSDVWYVDRITTTGDLSGNQVEEVGVLGEKSADGTVSIQFKDYEDKTVTKTISP